MLLSDRDIQAEIDADRIVIDPYTVKMLQPSSIDVHLGESFIQFDHGDAAVIDPIRAMPAKTSPFTLAEGLPMLLVPGAFLLATTKERVQLPDDIAARVEGRSSIGRCGLLIHVAAGFIDAGFSGQITLELRNLAQLPIRIRPGMSIGQLCFFRLSSPAEHPYGSVVLGSKYQGQTGAVASRGVR